MIEESDENFRPFAVAFRNSSLGLGIYKRTEHFFRIETN